MKKLIYILSIIIAVFLIYLAFNLPSTKENNSVSIGVLSAPEVFFDFSRVSMRGGNVSHDFILENNSSESVTIKKIYTSCMCTSVSVFNSSQVRLGTFSMPGHGLESATNITINPSESLTVKAIFDPAAHGPSGVGLAERSIYLETNSASSPIVEFNFKALVSN